MDSRTLASPAAAHQACNLRSRTRFGGPAALVRSGVSMTARVWDRFLTEQDRAHVAVARERRVGFADSPALSLFALYRWLFGFKPQPLLEDVKTWPRSRGFTA